MGKFLARKRRGGKAAPPFSALSGVSADLQFAESEEIFFGVLVRQEIHDGTEHPRQIFDADEGNVAVEIQIFVLRIEIRLPIDAVVVVPVEEQERLRGGFDRVVDDADAEVAAVGIVHEREQRAVLFQIGDVSRQMTGMPVELGLERDTELFEKSPDPSAPFLSRLT